MTISDIKTDCVAVCLAGVLGASDPGPVIGEPGDQPGPVFNTVRGDVLNIEDEFSFVKDMSGHEIRLHVDRDTQMKDRIKVGDKIEAQVTSDGHVKSIRIQLPEDFSSPGALPLP
ncbi:MAG: hypothetical protein C4294_15065 [Nitrospiraceae bacterium]